MRTPAACAVGIALIALAIWYRPVGADDFGPFYRAAVIASVHGNVYASPSWSPKDNAEGRFLPYLRIPSYAAALRPIATLPYAMARHVWIAALVTAICACAWLFPAGRDRFAIALAFSFPLADALMVGQDISLVLLAALASIRIFSAGREFLAGLVASLLSIKLTYLPAAGIVFAAKSRCGVWGFLTGVAIQMAVSFAVGGAAWPSEYLALLRNPLLDPEPGRMLNFHAAAFALSLPAAFYVAIGSALYLGFWFLCRRLSVTEGLLIALPLGLIASPHSRIYDAVVLIPLFVSVAALDSRVGRLALLALTPALYLVLLMAPQPYLFASVSLVIATSLAAAIRLYRMSETSVFELPAPGAAVRRA